MPQVLAYVQKHNRLAVSVGLAVLLAGAAAGTQFSFSNTVARGGCDADGSGYGYGGAGYGYGGAGYGYGSGDDGCDPVGTYIPVTPTRILDGRSTPQVLLGPGGTTDVKVTGVAGVPTTGVSAVVLNLTVDRPTLASYFTLAPTGGTTATSSLNFAQGETRAADTTIKVGTGGKVTIKNAFGQAFPIVDIQGYFADTVSPITGSSYVPLTNPTRVFDSRAGGPLVKFTAGETRSISLGTAVPAGATAVVANFTATNPTANDSYLTVFPSGIPRPVVSNLNFVTGRSLPNLATIPLGADGKIAVFNFAGSTDVLIDVAGYYVSRTSATVGDRFTPVAPQRLGDSRSGIGALTTFTTPNQVQNLTVTGVGGVPATNVSAVIVSITSDNVAAESFFTAFPKGGTAPPPEVSNLNPIAGENAANLAIVRVGTGGQISLLNRTPTANIIIDVYGYFLGAPATP